LTNTGYRIVVEEWWWDIPGIEPGYDKDQFDTENTVYVVVMSAQGRVLATVRVNPTTGPHMLSELFADYCDLQPYPVAPDVWECSRFVTDRAMMADPVIDFRVRCQLGIGLTVYCIDHGINRLSWLTHQAFYNLVQRVWKTEPLGLPRRTESDCAWIPAVSTIDIAALDRQLDRYRDAEAIVSQALAEKRSLAQRRTA
jgi:acyl-homoserine lactone synthase